MTKPASLETDNRLFTTTFQDGVLLLKSKLSIPAILPDIDDIYGLYGFLDALAESEDCQAMVTIVAQTGREEEDPFAYLRNSLVMRQDSLYFDRFANVVNRVFMTMSQLGCLTVYAGQGTLTLFHLNLGLIYDYRFATPHTRFENVNADLGMITKGSGYFPPRLLGVRKAAEVLQWRSFSAEEAMHLGLIDRIVPSEDLEREAVAFARDCLANPASTLAGVHKLLKCDVRELTRSLEQEDKVIAERMKSAVYKDAVTKIIEQAAG